MDDILENFDTSVTTKPNIRKSDFKLVNGRYISTKDGMEITEGYVVSYLLKGGVYKENNPEVYSWLLELRPEVEAFIAKIGLKLILDENEGYAFLASLTDDEFKECELVPTRKLMSSTKLTLGATVLLISLKKALLEFDQSGNQGKLVFTKEELRHILRDFLGTSTDEVKQDARLDNFIRQVKDLGFIKELNNKSRDIEERYEVKRIINGYFKAKQINDIEKLIDDYIKICRSGDEEE